MTPEMLRALRESVAAGEYATTSEAMRDAVRIWQRRRLEDAERLVAIRARIRRSLDDPRSSLSADEAEATMQRYFEQVAKERGDATA